MTWLRHFLGKNVVAWLVWGGLRAVPARASALESVLRMKFLLLFAVTLKRRSFRRAGAFNFDKLVVSCSFGAALPCRPRWATQLPS